MIPLMTPWSYPKRRKAVVATVETVTDSGRPERPANVGGAMMDYLKTTKHTSKVCPMVRQKEEEKEA